MPTTTPTLPTRADLNALWSRLSEVEDEIDDAARHLFEATNYEGAQEVTDEHVPAVRVRSRYPRLCSRLVSLAKKLDRAAMYDLDSIRAEGRQVNIPQFASNGAPTSIDAAEFERMLLSPTPAAAHDA